MSISWATEANYRRRRWPSCWPRVPRTQPGLHPDLPADTRLWAALQRASGGVWRGCVYDVERIIAALDAGLAVIDTET